MRIIKILAIGLIFLSCTKEKINIVISSDANEVEISAATILKDYCEKLYQDYSFVISSKQTSNYSVRIGLKNRFADSARCSQSPESFYIFHDSASVTIMASDNRGLLYAVYAQLEKLGCGFYLSTETMSSKKKFNISEWEIKDSPLITRRVVFNWHNFLSGCTAWNLKEWKQWIVQSSKMRFNTIMVHAYGNNPMYRFSYNGIKKESGYIATSVRGRDWGTEHVNDVRNLWGGEVFNDSIFGADAAKVDEALREESAVALMQQVFDVAQKQQMDICFAFDIATNSSNPQTILKSMPESAVIKNISGELLANPDSPEGYAYLKAHIDGILKDYPQVTMLAPWVRLHFPKPEGNYQTPAVFPEKWKKEYKAILKNNKDIPDNGHIQSIFYIGKVMKAYRKIIDEKGRNDIGLYIGTWGWLAFPYLDKFISDEVGFIPIDWSVNFDTENAMSHIGKIDSSRNLIPIVWAHHDDHKYIGKPYTPYENFTTLLNERNAEGYGIIHWTTRPLDLYFKSLSRQVWENSRDEKLKVTTTRMAEDIFETNNSQLSEYLYSWITTAPMLGRETTDFFFDIHKTPLADTLLHPDTKYDLADTAITLAKKRLESLNAINTTKLSSKANNWLQYYQGMEDFFISFFSDEKKLVEAYDACLQGNYQIAATIISGTQPEKTIEKYAAFSSIGEITLGEQGIVLAMNTKWLADFIEVRQQAGLEPARILFSHTQHEPLSQGAGRYTYYFDKNKVAYLCLGEKETNCAITDKGESTYLQSDSTFSINIMRYRHQFEWAGHTNAFKDTHLSAGIYTIKLLVYGDEKFNNEQIRFFSTQMNQPISFTMIQANTFEVTIENKDILKMNLTPKNGTIYLRGLEVQKIIK